MPLQIRLFSGTTGLNNRIDPVRLSFDREAGIAELSEAVNITIDSSGRVNRQKGYTLLTSGDFHSMCPFDCGGYTLAVRANVGLIAIDEHGNTTTVNASINSANGVTMDYEMASDGSKKFIYYMNGFDKGRVFDRTHYEWETGDYVGPDTTKALDDPPVGHLLCLFNGRMYVAINNVVYASERLNFGKFNYEDGYLLFPGRIAFLGRVSDGLFISDSFSTYFLRGQDLMPDGGVEPFALEKISDKPIVTGTCSRTEAENIGLDITGEVMLVWTDYGCFAAGSGGYFRNMTRDKLIRRIPAQGYNYLPDSTAGASIILNDEQFITTFT